MRQRNPGPYIIDIPTIDPPVRLLPGEEIDYPDPLAGLEQVGKSKAKSKDDSAKEAKNAEEA